MVAILLLIELFYTDTPILRTVGQSGVRRRDYQNFSEGQITHFLRYGATRAWSSAFKVARLDFLGGIPPKFEH